MAEQPTIKLSNKSSCDLRNCFKLIGDIRTESIGSLEYISSQPRLYLSKFLFIISLGTHPIGFVTAIKDDRLKQDVLSLDLCVKKDYRNIENANSIYNSLLEEAVKQIETRTHYSREFIVIDKNKTNIPLSIGIPISDDFLLLQDRKEEIDIIYPYGIKENLRVYGARKVYKSDKKRKSE